MSSLRDTGRAGRPGLVDMVTLAVGPVDEPSMREGKDFADQAVLEGLVKPGEVRALSGLAVRLVMVAVGDRQEWGEAAAVGVPSPTAELPAWRVDLWRA